MYFPACKTSTKLCLEREWVLLLSLHWGKEKRPCGRGWPPGTWPRREVLEPAEGRDWQKSPLTSPRGPRGQHSDCSWGMTQALFTVLLPWLQKRGEEESHMLWSECFPDSRVLTWIGSSQSSDQCLLCFSWEWKLRPFPDYITDFEYCHGKDFLLIYLFTKT